MSSLIVKLRGYGVRRAFVHISILLTCKYRVLLYKWFFSENSPRMSSSKVLSATQFVGKGKIEIDQAQLGVWPSPGLLSSAGYIEARCETAKVVIGNSTYINNSFVIIADRESILIGNRCLIGPNLFISDSDFHSLDYKNRSLGNYECGRVIIEDDVFIGEGVRVLKGVRIGAGSVIGSGSLVVDDVEPNSIYAGVPAKKIRAVREVGLASSSL